MHIVVVGASHRTAPVSLLERISVSPADLDNALGQVKELTTEGFMLSTCNRTEIYAVLAGGADAATLTGWLAGRAGEAASPRSQFYVHIGAAAVSHALRVASGLDSMALGEDQIQAQFKRALHSARGAEMLGPRLERLGAAALGCGKRARAFTGIGRDALSLESIAVDIALPMERAASPANVVVIGSGSSATVLLRHLCERDLVDVSVVGRTASRAQALAEANGARFVHWETLSEALVTADAVFCCTSAPHPVLTAETLAQRTARSTRPLTCVDLGMPHDVDPAVAEIAGVSMVGLQALGTAAESRRASRSHHVSAAESIVERETLRLLAWLDSRDKTGEIVRVRAHADAVADAELRRALARMPNLAARERAIVAHLARRIARQLAHQRTDAIKHPEIALMAEQA